MPQYTYFGALDDVVEKYPWDYRVTPQVIHEQLLTEVLFGDPILLNDGYVIMNPIIQRALCERGTEAPLRVLIEEGFIKIYARGGQANLVEGIMRSAESGVETHRQLITTSFWRETLRPALERIARDPRTQVVAWPADKNTGHIFHQLLKNAVFATEKGIWPLDRGLALRTYELYLKSIDEKYSAARTKWENAAKSVVASQWLLWPRSQLRRLMNVANEAYHVAHSIAASYATGCRVNAQTAYAPTFTEYFQCEPGIWHEKLRELMIVTPTRISFDTGTFMRDFTRGETKLGSLKRNYLSALNRCIATGDGFDVLSDLSAEYKNAIADALFNERRPPKLFSPTWLSGTVGLAFAVIPDDNAMSRFAGAILLAYALERARPIVLRLFNKEWVLRDLTPPPGPPPKHFRRCTMRVPLEARVTAQVIAETKSFSG